MTRIKGQLTTADYLPIEDFNRLINGLHGDKEYMWELYCCLSFCTALRASDVRMLRWNEVLGKEKFVKIEQKTGKARRIRLNDSVEVKLLEIYNLMNCPEKCSLIFNNSATQKPYSLEYINRTLKVFRVKYRLPKINFSTHTFRKTFGRYVYDSGGRSAESLVLLNMIFKHSNLDTTKRYLGITQDEIDKVYQSIIF